MNRKVILGRKSALLDVVYNILLTMQVGGRSPEPFYVYRQLLMGQPFILWLPSLPSPPLVKDFRRPCEDGRHFVGWFLYYHTEAIANSASSTRRPRNETLAPGASSADHGGNCVSLSSSFVLRAAGTSDSRVSSALWRPPSVKAATYLWNVRIFRGRWRTVP